MDGNLSTLKIRTYLKDQGLPQPVIIQVTGQTEDSYLKKAFEYGANGICGKPFDGKILESVLRVLKYID